MYQNSKYAIMNTTMKRKTLPWSCFWSSSFTTPIQRGAVSLFEDSMQAFVIFDNVRFPIG